MEEYPKWIYKFNEEPKLIYCKEEFESGWFETPQTEVKTKRTVTNKEAA